MHHIRQVSAFNAGIRVPVQQVLAGTEVRSGWIYQAEQSTR